MTRLQIRHKMAERELQEQRERYSTPRRDIKHRRNCVEFNDGSDYYILQPTIYFDLVFQTDFPVCTAS